MTPGPAGAWAGQVLVHDGIQFRAMRQVDALHDGHAGVTLDGSPYMPSDINAPLPFLRSSGAAARGFTAGVERMVGGCGLKARKLTGWDMAAASAAFGMLLGALS